MKLRFVGLHFGDLVRVLSCAVLLNFSLTADAQTTAGDTLFNAGDAARGIVPCMSCHGPNGNSMIPENPKLAGQGAAYIAKQLHDFKAKVRVNPVMGSMAAPLSDADINNIAAYVSAQPVAVNTSKNKDTLELGRRIFRGGIASKNIPACAACHGANGAGIPAQFPRLAGQHQTYAKTQLNDFRAGTRVNTQMNAIAGLLSDKEIDAVTDYIAGLK